MKTKLLILGVFACVTAIVLSGCVTQKSGLLSEGVIEYDASLVNKDNPLASFAPSKMTFSFKDSRCRGDLSAAYGMFNTAFISSIEEKKVIQLVRIVNQKYVHTFDSEAVKKENESLPPFTIKPASETKNIAGFKCQKATIDFEDNRYPDFDVFYTDEIEIESPNWGTPFFGIEGVLMEYQVSKYGMELKFTAKSVTKSQVDNKEFEIPVDYKAVTAQELDDLFKSFQ